MVAHPTLVKRPVFEGKGILLQCFTDVVKNKLN
jgi:arsenate reductase-like glutaredoxin family protein